MTSCLLRTFSRLEWRTRSLLDQLCTWSPEQLRFRPSPTSWSALELIEHLVLTEQAVLQMMRSNVGEGHVVTVSDRFRSAVVLGLMALPLRLKVPHAVNQISPSQMHPDLILLRDSWSDERRVLAEFLAGLSVADRKSGVFRHPAGGWATASGALLFLRLHLWHHTYQFRRLRKTVRTQQQATGIQVFERKTLN